MAKHKIIIKHFIVAIALILYVALVRVCVFRAVFSIPCPFCGMTRAYLSLLNLDIVGAFQYHPLFLFIPIFLFFAFHYKMLKISSKTANIIIILGALIIFSTYIIRIAKGSII